MVHGVLMTRVARNEVADLVQDAFLAAFRKLHTLRDAAAFGPWLAMIAVTGQTIFTGRFEAGILRQSISIACFFPRGRALLSV